MWIESYKNIGSEQTLFDLDLNLIRSFFFTVLEFEVWKGEITGIESVLINEGIKRLTRLYFSV